MNRPASSDAMPAGPRDRAAFTFMEVMVTVAVIGLFIGAAFFGLLKLNSYAISNRLNTCATQMVQEVIDQALSVRPFYSVYKSSSGLVSADPFDQARNAVSGTSGVPSGLMVTGTLGKPVVTTIPIFVDPDVLTTGTTAALKTLSQVLSAATLVTGTLTVQSCEASPSTGGTISAPAVSGTSALRWVSVSLSYQFCGQTFNIQRSCLRAPDQ